MIVLPMLAPFTPYETHPQNALSHPNSVNLLGTDLLGRDVLSRVLYGGRQTIQLALSATLVSTFVGGLIGIVSGVAPRYIEIVASSVVDALLAIPPLVTALVVITMLGRGDWQISIAIGISQIANFAKVTKDITKGIYQQPYIDGAIASGATSLQIIYRHILPNINPITLSYAGIVFSYSILNGAALSFLGLGGGIGTPDWGVLMNEGRAILHIAPFVTIAPGICIILVVAFVSSMANRFTHFPAK